MRIDVISNLGKSDALFDSSIYNVCRQSKTKLATVLYNVHSQTAVHEKMQQNHFRLSDDLVALYLTNPELFGINTMTDRLNVRYNKDYDLPGVKEAMCDMIKGIYLRAAILYSAGFLFSVKCSDMMSARLLIPQLPDMDMMNGRQM